MSNGTELINHYFWTFKGESNIKFKAHEFIIRSYETPGITIWQRMSLLMGSQFNIRFCQ